MTPKCQLPKCLAGAAAESTEEAVINSLFASETMDGHQGRIEALPIDDVVRLHQRIEGDQP